MICPVDSSDMIVIEYQKIELDYCPRCHGVWFDTGELELLLKSAALAGSNLAQSPILKSPEVRTAEEKRRCPICRLRMRKTAIGKPPIMIDACPRGDGLWFDGGEVGGLIKSLAGKTGDKVGPRKEVADFIGTVFKAPN